MRRLSTREHLLLAAAAAVALATGLYFPRIRPALARVEALEEQRVRVEEQILEARWPRTPEDPGRLAARRDALRAEAEAARDALRRAERRFASRCDPALADELRLALSALAVRHGIRFRENLSCPETALRSFAGESAAEAGAEGASGLVRFLTLGEPYRLGARQVTIETDFAGLRGFLRELDRLDHRVLVLRFDVAVEEGDRPGTTSLLATLILVF